MSTGTPASGLPLRSVTRLCTNIRSPGRLARDIGAVRHRLVLADIERAEHGGLGGAVALAMVHRIDQHRNPEHVRQQDEFLPGRRAFLADAGQKIDRIAPFVEGEIGLADDNRAATSPVLPSGI